MNFFREIIYIFIYFLFIWSFIFILSFNYGLEILAYLCLGLEESMIVHDSSDWAWALFFLSFFFSINVEIFYFVFLGYLFFSNFLIKKEKDLIMFQIGVYLYIEILVIIIFNKDIFFSTFFYIPTIKNIFFEFQLELETYLYLILGFFFDLNTSLIFIQIFIISFFFIRKIYDEKINKYFFIFILFLIVYWFGGENLVSDFFLFLFLLCLLEILVFIQKILINLRRIRN
jgi:hypothetical protein